MKFFSNQFSGTDSSEEFSLLHHIDPMVTRREDTLIKNMPEEEELKSLVFKLSGDSACEPDGFTGHFFHKCWSIVGSDIINIVHVFSGPLCLS